MMYIDSNTRYKNQCEIFHKQQYSTEKSLPWYRNTACKDIHQTLTFCGDEDGKLYALRDIFRKV